jgi:LPS-assembly lipoprotein
LSLDRSFRRIAIVINVAAVTTLAGCQVRPLYSESGGVGQRLTTVAFADPHNRIEQVVRNNLVFLASGGAGEPARPEYDVKLSAESSASSILDITSDDDTVSVTNVPIAGRVEVDVTYTLTRMRDGQVLKSAKRQVVAQIDVSGQSFAKLRAIRDAENRASREAAEFIRGEIAIALAREPQPQAVWQK